MANYLDHLTTAATGTLGDLDPATSAAPPPMEGAGPDAAATTPATEPTPLDHRSADRTGTHAVEPGAAAIDRETPPFPTPPPLGSRSAPRGHAAVDRVPDAGREPGPDSVVSPGDDTTEGATDVTERGSVARPDTSSAESVPPAVPDPFAGVTPAAASARVPTERSGAALDPPAPSSDRVGDPATSTPLRHAGIRAVEDLGGPEEEPAPTLADDVRGTAGNRLRERLGDLNRRLLASHPPDVASPHDAAHPHTAATGALDADEPTADGPAGHPDDPDESALGHPGAVRHRPSAGDPVARSRAASAAVSDSGRRPSLTIDNLEVRVVVDGPSPPPVAPLAQPPARPDGPGAEASRPAWSDANRRHLRSW